MLTLVDGVAQTRVETTADAYVRAGAEGSTLPATCLYPAAAVETADGRTLSLDGTCG